MLVRLNNVPKKFNPVEIKSALNFFAEKLMHKNLCKNIRLLVCFGDRQDNTTCWEDDNIRPREFTITINSKMGYSNMITTLAHEMVHVKQYATGQLRDSMRGPSLQRWMNMPINSNDIEYWDLPWEVEAYGRERGLYFRFRQQGKKDVKA
jgi:hypothetical protein